jgi:transglutaminase-like putative cysteine protease
LSDDAAPRREAALRIDLDRPEEYLFLPEGAAAVEVPVGVRLDPAGGLVLAGSADGPMSYRVTVTEPPAVRDLDPPRPGGLEFGIHPAVVALAEEVTAGLEDDVERAAAIERFLQTEFTYSLTGAGRTGPDPVAWFLLRSRTGHCEYFAGGMVVLLDALGIPSRMVAGYSGGTASGAGDEVVVRESNAHAWVEVWLGEARGWVAHDPTPSAGVPGLSRVKAGDRLRFAWEWIQASWDRYVLTFGLGEQIDLLAVVGGWFSGLAASVHWRDAAWLVVAAGLAWGLGVLLRRVPAWRGLGPPGAAARTPAARAVRRLARNLEREGVEVPESATVRWIGRTARFHWPSAAQAAGDLVWLAERELYSSGGSPYGAAEVRRVWADLRRAIRQS